MNKLVYDMELEKQARQWAEGCVFKVKEGRGENLAWDSNEKPEKELIKNSTQRWFDEKRMYSYGQDSCGSSCNYTQMVWWSTQKVGCYSVTCPNLVRATENAWWIVCFYTPKGNWNGQKPYETSCAKKCNEGHTEDNGLCVVDYSVCDDKKGRCPLWAKNQQCEKNPELMLKNCRKSCKVCVSKDV